MALTLPGIWTTLDTFDDAELYDTAEEAAAFVTCVRAEARAKLASGGAARHQSDWRDGTATAGVQSMQNANISERIKAPGRTGVKRQIDLVMGKENVIGIQSSHFPYILGSTVEEIEPTVNNRALATDFDRSFLPSFHASHIQHCSTPFHPHRSEERHTRSASTAVITPEADRTEGQGRVAASPGSPASVGTKALFTRTRDLRGGAREPSSRRSAAAVQGEINAQAGPGPSTIAARSRAKFSKVVSAPVLPRPAVPSTRHLSATSSSTSISLSRSAKTAAASAKGPGTSPARSGGVGIVPPLGMTRRRVVSDQSLAFSAYTSPSHHGIGGDSRVQTTPALDARTPTAADTSIAPSLAEAPSRTLVAATPLPATPADTRISKRPPILALARAGRTGMSIDIPPTNLGDVTHTPIVASPVDTPTIEAPRRPTTSTSHHAENGSTSEVAITPLGNAKLRTGKSFLSLTKHFEAFTKALNRPEKVKVGKGRAGAGKAASTVPPPAAADARVSADGKQGGKIRGEAGHASGVDGAGVKVAEGASRGKAAEGLRRFSMVPLGRSSTMVAAPINAVDGILSGCRFCIPPDHGGLSKHKHRWDIIVKLGGAVVLEPDTAVTHIIYEGRAPAALARELGLGSIDDLPEGCVCVKWEWVANCKLQSCKLDTGPYLSFSRKASGGSGVSLGGPSGAAGSMAFGSRTGSGIGATRASSRLFDITDQLKGTGRAAGATTSATGIRKRREATASDSETESSNLLVGKRIRSSPIQLQRQPIRPRTTSSPAKMGGTPDVSIPGLGAEGAQMSTTSIKERAVPTTATDHGPATRAEWNDGGTQDGLDIMISGVQSGKVDSRLEEEDKDTSPDRDTDHRATILGERNAAGGHEGTESGNPCPMADRFKCGQAHDGFPASPEDHPNEWLAKKFDEMHEMYSGAKHKNDWQIRGYRNAAAAMRRTKWPIKSGEEAIKIKGIGTSMKDRIDEFISGRPGRQFYDMDEQMQAVSAFAKIYGVGKHLANDLYTRGARTLSDLSAPSNPYNLSPNQLTGVALYDDLNTRIPRAECKEIFDLVRSHATKIDPKVWIEIMGSYRRGSENSGDVDILITRDTEDGRDHGGVIRRLVGGLVERGIITHELSCPHDWHALEAKWMGVCRLPGGLHRRIDILCIPFEQWGAALLYFTGNDIFNRSLRLYARKMGYSLNQRGLSKNVIRGKDGLKFTEGEIVASRTEQEIFDRLGLRWRPPHQRRP